MKKTGLIILNYNNFEDTVNCIESVERYNSAPVKIIVVDNGSTHHNCVENLDSYLKGRYSATDYIRLEENNTEISDALPYMSLLVSPNNDGYARGNNKGLRLAQKDDEIDCILILNNDILFIDDIIPRLRQKKSVLPECGIISPLLMCRDGKTIDINCARLATDIRVMIRHNLFHYFRLLAGKKRNESWRYLLTPDAHVTGDVVEIELPSGACMMIDKETFADIGWFDPNTFLYYEEDILHKKLSASGLKNYLDTSCRCIHLGASSTRKSPGRFIIRSGLDSERYFVENYSGASALAKFIYRISATFFWMTFRLQQASHIRINRSN